MSPSKIKQLEDLLAEQLGQDKKIIDIEEADFLGKGENFGSTIFRVDVTVRDEKTGEEEVIHTVAKTLPEAEELRHVFNVQVTVGKEISFYNLLVPHMKEFLRESGVDDDIIDFFPKLHGGRLNLNGSGTVDQDAVVLLENLITAGFKTIDRFEGFDYETAKLVLKDIAALHAIPLAIRLMKPDVYDKVFRELCVFAINHDSAPSDDGGDSKGPGNPLLEILFQNDKCLSAAIKIAGKYQNMKLPDVKKANGPWCTLAHNDLWVNNIMIKFENGKPVEHKLVDFQNYAYNSCARDVFFFMWTSIKREVLDESLDELLLYYHKHFFGILKKVGCDTTPYTFDLFMKEYNGIAKDEIMHVLMFILIVYGPKGGSSNGPFVDAGKMLRDLSLSNKEKIWYMAQEWERRKWL